EDWIGRHFLDLLHRGSCETGVRRFQDVLAGAPPYCEGYQRRT
ncbi:MAG: hypothetical protein JWO56_3651, partial [Acidobacteria bacterium]|nr:hypothetical protein [Acidobacteriota bacterium]